MIGPRDDKPEIQKFLDDYQEKFSILQKEAREIFINCHDHIEGCSPEDFYVRMEERIGALRSLSSINIKIQAIKNERGVRRVAYDQLTKGGFNTQQRFHEFADKVGHIIYKAEDYDKTTVLRAKDICESLRRCPFGEQENKTRNALFFQQMVLELLDWLFVNELERMDLSEIEDGSQRRDGGFEVTKEFATQERCGFPFKHLFVECKNYKNGLSTSLKLQ